MTKMLYSGEEVPNGAVREWQEGNDRIDDIDMSIQSWKVLEVDRNNNKVTLVAEEPTESRVRLVGAQGYNNGVKLLNDACRSLYGGNIMGVEARSINMTDIEKLMDEVPEYLEKHSDNIGYESDRSEDGSYTANKVYPTIYEEEALREIDEEYSATGLNRDEAISQFVNRANSSKTANQSIHPTNTHYTLENSDLTTKLGEYSSLIISKGENTNYWIASRCIGLGEQRCRYYMRVLFHGTLNEPAGLMTSGSATVNTFSIAECIFPVLTLSAGTITSTEIPNTYEFIPFN